MHGILRLHVPHGASGKTGVFARIIPDAGAALVCIDDHNVRKLPVYVLDEGRQPVRAAVSAREHLLAIALHPQPGDDLL